MAGPRTTDDADPAAVDADARAALWLTVGVTLARLIALFRTPLELFPDEAQSWLWSRTLAFGYDTKPPIVAWAIWASTAFGGDTEPWVRLPAVLFQAGATLLVFAIARRLYGSRAGLAGAALYALTPAIQLSATVVATDAPLLFFIGLTILAYVGLQEAEGRLRTAQAGLVGAALGLAFLSKYAAVYGLMGIGLHLALSPAARSRWSAASAGLSLAAFLAVLGPNLAWNAAHGFATIAHAVTADHGLGDRLFDPRELARFLGLQFALFGPIPLAVLIGGAALLAWRRRLEAADVLLLCFTLPPIALVAIQALVGRANANGSGAGYLPGAILVAAWLLRWRARRLLIAALAMQGVIAAGFLALVAQPRIADSLGLGNGLKRARGWEQTAQIVVRKIRDEQPAGLTAIAVNNRLLYFALAYYGRNYFKEPLAAPLKIWVRSSTTGDHVEAGAPLTAASGQRVLAVAYEGWFRDEMAADFARESAPEIDDIWLDRKRHRRMEMFVGEDFQPQPRDPKTGYPTSGRRPVHETDTSPTAP